MVQPLHLHRTNRRRRPGTFGPNRRVGHSGPGYLSQVRPLEPARHMEEPGLSRIARALVALVVVMAVAGVGALGTLMVLRARDDATGRANAAVRDRARVVAQLVHDALKDDVSAVIATTSRPVFHLAVVNKNYVQTHGYLSELLATHPRLATVAVYDGGGRLVTRIPSDPGIAGKQFSQQEYFRAARGSGFAHISSLFSQLGAPRVPVIAYSIRVFHHGGIFGVLAATTPITAFDSLVSPYAPAGWTVRVYNQAGERVSPSTEASGRTYTTDPVVGPALKGGSDLQRTGGSIVAAAPVTDYGWAVVVSQPAKAADAGVRKLTERLAILAGGAFLLALIAAALAWSRRTPAGS